MNDLIYCTGASEIAFPSFEHWERFSAQTISAFDAYMSAGRAAEQNKDVVFC